MSGIEFDRDAVGVNAKANWTDSRSFVEIAAGFGATGVDGVAYPIPGADGTGAAALTGALRYYTDTLRTVCLEFSDACAVLGSGQEAAISNTDQTEKDIMAQFSTLASRLEGRL
ncbi:hypothetical protein [Schaalia sp. Marseille-Q2122]|uniref:hypothetical protein n=1 Tax=Schaalia sp. Marseille-Q2122 TaxID=2736604 RepID=UPI0015885E5F|nr:hypothetical protein [Schaalia sp. Marseille-Q2122]